MVITGEYSVQKLLLDEFMVKYRINARDFDIFRLIIEGKSTNQIGTQLFISTGTVRNNLSSIFLKQRPITGLN